MRQEEDTIEECLEMIEYYKKERADILRQYGTGMRPSFVSADIASADMGITRWREAAENLGHKFED
tara:strand:- start:268 stop:465 length:198 start_codon:yes stop_codon:yes gene_type:complete